MAFKAVRWGFRPAGRVPERAGHGPAASLRLLFPLDGTVRRLGRRRPGHCPTPPPHRLGPAADRDRTDRPEGVRAAAGGAGAFTQQDARSPVCRFRPSRRAARLTVSPSTVNASRSAGPTEPATTAPRVDPDPRAQPHAVARTGGCPEDPGMSRAQATARSAWSARAGSIGSRQVETDQHRVAVLKLLITPPWRSIGSAIAARYSFRRSSTPGRGPWPPPGG